MRIFSVKLCESTVSVVNQLMEDPHHRDTEVHGGSTES